MTKHSLPDAANKVYLHNGESVMKKNLLKRNTAP